MALRNRCIPVIAFFERQQQMQGQTRRMLLLFAAAVLGTVAAVDGLVWAFMRWLHGVRITSVGAGIDSQTPMVMGIATIVVLGVILISSAIRLRHLDDGGAAIAARLGGREIDFDPTNPDEQRLRNVVEEMAIASTVPVPRIFILDAETAINAFAAGSNTDDCAIAVSAGALQHLDRDELQGVVAHEFSHILNGDMRLNLRLMALLFGLFAVTVAGRVLFHLGRASRSSRASLPIFLGGASLLLVGSIGLFAGRVIQAAISRSRERLADAAAVQFTRQQRGLANALKKIAAYPQGTRLQNPHAGEVAHMLFGDGVSRIHWLSTHPPLLERIQALEPGFGPARLQAFVQRWQTGQAAGQAPPPAQAQDRSALGAGAVMSLDSAPSATIPVPSSRLPLDWQLLVRDADSAMAVLTDLLDGTPGNAAIAALPVNQQVNLALLALSRLRSMDNTQRDPLRRRLQQPTDGSLRSLCLRLLASQHLQATRAREPLRLRQLHECAREIAGLLNALALLGHDDAEIARLAFLRALHAILPQHALAMQRSAPAFDTLQSALWKLDHLDIAGKRVLTEAMRLAVVHDGHVNVEEHAVLRCFCACLHCPMPELPEG